ncbi:DUF4136 domain-containing protein [Pyxidicoccus xibeiensis]|uniref:DUF4136 domain-containing protein n=1 Tax=Pyxidicoccus xibeiensis TaxID=2906759 RepID=UPI0020A70A6C|nr:DUF4136 domain-containing protein [Pyxidicoccus xibeiensis]MCP3140375.1 DUF4136 domain-containing protein [Pyxidicoccus xibeiensis]
MRMLPRLACPLLTLLLAACAGIDVSTQYDSSAARESGGFRTYAWVPPPPGQAPRVFSGDMDISVEKSVDAYLQARGYQQVEASASPSFLIDWGGAVSSRTRLVPSIGRGPEMTPRQGMNPYPNATPPPSGREYSKGVLDLDIMEARTQKLVWRGTARGDLPPEPRAEEVQDWLNEAVSKLLGDFRARAGKR